MGYNATDLISEAVMIMQLEGTVYDIAKAIHPPIQQFQKQ